MDEIQENLIKLLQKKLNLKIINTNKNFFDLGLDSVGIAELNAALSLIIKKKIDILLFYEFPTISMLSAELKKIVKDSI